MSDRPRRALADDEEPEEIPEVRFVRRARSQRVARPVLKMSATSRRLMLPALWLRCLHPAKIAAMS